MQISNHNYSSDRNLVKMTCKSSDLTMLTIACGTSNINILLWTNNSQRHKTSSLKKSDLLKGGKPVVTTRQPFEFQIDACFKTKLAGTSAVHQILFLFHKT